MDKNLFIAIERAEIELEEAEDFAQVIITLSKHPRTTETLVNAFRDAAVNAELLWRDIEQRDDFKAHYSDREQAHIDFLKA